MKILIIKNKDVDEKFYDDQMEDLSYFSRLKKIFGIKNIKFTVDEITADERIVVSAKDKAPNGKTGYTLKYFNNNLIPYGYDFVLFVYEGVPLFSKTRGNYAYSRKKSINGAFVAEVPDISKAHAFIHELIHLMFFKARSLGHRIYDQMDRTFINGKWRSYYKNKMPEYIGGNYHISLKILEPYIKYLEDKVVIKQNPIIKFFTPKYSANFNKAVKVILKNEGGYVNNPKDKGGETNFGISKRSYPRLDIKNLTKEKAIDIYYKDFWIPTRCNELEYKSALILFDMAVNHGRIRAVKILQKTIGTKQDGIFGNKTLQAVRNADSKMFIDLSNNRMGFYMSLRTFKTFGKGWKNRVFDLLKEVI